MLHNLLLFSVVAAQVSGSVYDAISACSGESVKLFNIISFTPNSSVVSLYVNYSKFDLIATWPKGKNATVIKNFSLDDHGTVWIHNVTLSDERKYKVVHIMNATYRDLWRAQLTVLVAPTNSCRPHVTRDGNTLIASLQVGTDCGRPEAVPYLLEDPNITHNNKTTATLIFGREAGTYKACMETPALSCARSYNISDFCSPITVPESCYPTLFLHSTLIAIAVLICIGLFMTTFILILCRKRKRRLRNKQQELDPMTNDDSMVRLVHFQSIFR